MSLANRVIVGFPRYLLTAFFIVCIFLSSVSLLNLFKDSFSPSFLQNLTRVFNEDQLIKVLKNTLILFSIATVLQICLAILITIHYQRVSLWLKLLFIAPYALGVVAPAFSMNVLFSSMLGPFHEDILGNALGGTLIIILIDSWQWLGVLLLGCFLILERIPKSHFEQAELERISRFRRWWFIARPQIQYVAIFYGAIRLIDWIRKVDILRALFGDGGPGYFAETFGIYILKNYYQLDNKGFASLLSLLQIIVLGLLITITLSGLRRTTFIKDRNA